MRAWGKDVVAGNGCHGIRDLYHADERARRALGGLSGELPEPPRHCHRMAGNVYVADTVNHRIQKFDSAGHFLLTWGKDVNIFGSNGFETCNAAAIAGQRGLGGWRRAQLPPGRSGGVGNLYVADTLNGRIQEFNSSGSFLRTWGKDVDNIGGWTGFEICTAAANCRRGLRGGWAGSSTGPKRRDVATGRPRPRPGNGSLFSRRYGQQTGSRGSMSFGNFLRTWGKDVNTGGGTGFEICTAAASCKAGPLRGQ